MSMQPPQAVAAGTRSPDGYWVWDGTQWMRTTPDVAAAAAPQGRRSPLVIAGAAVSIGAIAILGASYLTPFETYDAGQGYPAGSYTLFTLDFLQGAALVVQVIVFLGTAIAVMAVAHRMIVAIGSGALVAFGVHELTDSIGLVGSVLSVSGDHIAVGTILNVIGALALIIGGVIALLGAFSGSQRVAPL